MIIKKLLFLWFYLFINLWLSLFTFVNCDVIAKDTEHEKLILQEFRELVQDSLYRSFMTSDGYLIRWLKANNMNPEVAAEKLSNTLEWRKENDIDNILREDFSLLQESFPITVDGFDKDGRPLLWFPFGSYDLRKITLAGKGKEYIRYLLYLSELLELYLYDLGQNITIHGAVVINDYAGVSFKKIACLKCLTVVPEVVKNYDFHYPDLHYKAFVINVPSLLNSFISMSRSFISEHGNEALHVFDNDREKWIEGLKEQISLNELPIEYGGTKLSKFHKSYKIRNKVFVDIVEHEQWAIGTQRQDIEWEPVEIATAISINGAISEAPALPNNKQPEPVHNHHHHHFQTKSQDNKPTVMKTRLKIKPKPRKFTTNSSSLLGNTYHTVTIIVCYVLSVIIAL